MIQKQTSVSNPSMHLRLSQRSTPPPALLLLSLAKAPPVASHLTPDTAWPVVKIGREPILTHPPPPYSVDCSHETSSPGKLKWPFKSQSPRPSVKPYDRCPDENGVKSSLQRRVTLRRQALKSLARSTTARQAAVIHACHGHPNHQIRATPFISSPTRDDPSLPIDLRWCTVAQASTIQRLASPRLPMQRQPPRTRTVAALQMSHDLSPSSSVDCKSSRPFPALKLKCPKSSSLMLQTVSRFNIGPRHSGANSGASIAHVLILVF
ncbi:hypothetical protein C8F04DRAFT_1181020 [Mycena alexandri]|uniref:Uncharacterized protein n=1 Tax=Mycena alexandri TaxID=1745969 RepID=A0AAD6T047_9AGAR|nr:hypothetical protein C8F04DRAFT_1181020 [Mycena alexandri]